MTQAAFTARHSFRAYVGQMASGVLKTNRAVAASSNATPLALSTRSVVAPSSRPQPAVMTGLEVVWEGTLSG